MGKLTQFKFTASEIVKYKELKKRIESAFKVLKSNPLYKSPTATNFNKAQLSQIFELYEAGVELSNLGNSLSFMAYKDYQYANEGTQTDKYGFTIKSDQLSARGWHKDHNNYNKAEKWELPPSLRRTPARNVTKTGAKRKRATTITKYKR